MGLFIADGFVRMGLFVADGLQMALLQMGLFAVGHAGEASGRRRCYCFVVGGELAGHIQGGQPAIPWPRGGREPPLGQGVTSAVLGWLAGHPWVAGVVARHPAWP
jgi:hypothetical protein